jgi:NAD(P)-dependent dehydrogenase (short-subunit alcohol dehydrogenase family)
MESVPAKEQRGKIIMAKLKDKVAVVTGAARGNGEGSARVMAKEGAIVALTDVSDKVHETANSIRDQGYQAVSFNMDVTKASQVAHVVQKIEEQFGRVDILVNNAGVAKGGPLVRLPDEVRDLVLDVNIRGVFICSKAVLPGMIQRKYGKIVNVSSVTGPMVCNAGQCAYAASKGAILAFTRALAIEVATYNINVNAICPGWIDTPMMRWDPDPDQRLARLAKTIPWGRLGTSEEIGNLVAFLASDESRYITGTPIVIDGGSTLPEGNYPPRWLQEE